MAIELYHAGMSVCSEKVRIFLAERGHEYISHTLDLRAGDQQKPEYIKLNPNAVVPTIVHDGNVITESNVILEYLAEVLPGPSLTTSSPVSRAGMRVWTKQLDEGIHQLTSVISFAIGFRHHHSDFGKIRDAVGRHGAFQLEKGSAGSTPGAPVPMTTQKHRTKIANGPLATSALWKSLTKCR